MNHKITILGQEYTIKRRTEEQDPLLRGKEAYVLPQIHLIVIEKSLTNKRLLTHVLLHEVVHAYFFESGLDEKYSYDEDLVNWIAWQLESKLVKTNADVKNIVKELTAKKEKKMKSTTKELLVSIYFLTVLLLILIVCPFVSWRAQIGIQFILIMFGSMMVNRLGD